MDPDRLMRQMMQGSLFGPMFNADFANPMHPHNSSQDLMSAMMPHSFMSPMPMMMNPFQQMQQAMSMGGGVSYCSSSVTSYTTDEHGRTQVYQQSNEVKQGPNGVKETKSAVRDSRTGHQEMAIGHHLRDKAHIKKKSKNAYTNEEELCEDFVGIDESEAESFEQNWQRQARNVSAIQYDNPRSARNSRLAITNEPSSHRESPHHKDHRSSGLSSIIDKVAMKAKKKKKSKEPKE